MCGVDERDHILLITHNDNQCILTQPNPNPPSPQKKMIIVHLGIILMTKNYKNLPISLRFQAELLPLFNLFKC